MNVEYITDEYGNQKAVIIPIDEWNKLKNNYDYSQENKEDILSGIKNALKEVKQIKQGQRKKGKTLSEFLNEV